MCPETVLFETHEAPFRASHLSIIPHPHRMGILGKGDSLGKLRPGSVSGANLPARNFHQYFRNQIHITHAFDVAYKFDQVTFDVAQ